MAKTEPFDEDYEKYEDWFEKQNIKYEAKTSGSILIQGFFDVFSKNNEGITRKMQK